MAKNTYRHKEGGVGGRCVGRDLKKKKKKKKPSMTTGSIFKEIRERMNETTTTNFKKQQPEALPHFSFHHFLKRPLRERDKGEEQVSVDMIM